MVTILPGNVMMLLSHNYTNFKHVFMIGKVYDIMIKIGFRFESIEVNIINKKSGKLCTRKLYSNKIKYGENFPLPIEFIEDKEFNTKFQKELNVKFNYGRISLYNLLNTEMEVQNKPYSDHHKI